MLFVSLAFSYTLSIFEKFFSFFQLPLMMAGQVDIIPMQWQHKMVVKVNHVTKITMKNIPEAMWKTLVVGCGHILLKANVSLLTYV